MRALIAKTVIVAVGAGLLVVAGLADGFKSLADGGLLFLKRVREWGLQ